MNWKRIGAWCGVLAGLQFVVITFAIMPFYPGGYSFFENYFSQLGLSETNGVPTPLNWLMFALATILGGALSFPFWLSIRTVFTETTSLRALSGLGTTLGILSCPCLAGIGIFAADLFLVAHALSTILFFVLFAAAVGLYSVCILLSKEYENVYALVGVVVCAICLVHILAILTAAMQKLAVYSIVLYSVFQGYKLLQVFQ
ncbi:MAG: hypothetical protein ACFFEF_12550 [Candidatus Thorarchaeota archaeon]